MSDSEDSTPVPLDESPAMIAVRLAMQAAQEAADARAEAKARERARRPAGDLARGDEDFEVIAATAVDREAFERASAEDDDAGLLVTFDLDGQDALPLDVDDLVEELARSLPDVPQDERHGDLVIKRSEDHTPAWYELAANEALPAALRDVGGPLDVKRLLTALLVEVGDVKRTNAMLMEQLARIEEKVDRTHRAIRPKGH